MLPILMSLKCWRSRVSMPGHHRNAGSFPYQSSSYRRQKPEKAVFCEKPMATDA